MASSIRQYFDNRFSVLNLSANMLPFFHTCDAFFFRSILTEKKLIPTKCNVFENENLLYLFYGRPAYKSSNLTSSRLNSLLPVSFILRSDFTEKIKRITPFDTGAFQRGLYKDYIHPGMQVDNFFLTPNKEAIKKTISYFFDTNEAYFMGRATNNILYDPIDFEIESYYNLIKGVAQSAVDDRKATIEVQLECDFRLTFSSVEAVILPQNFLSSKVVEDTIRKELNADIITYESFGIPSPLYYSQMLELTKQYLIKKACLHG